MATVPPHGAPITVSADHLVAGATFKTPGFGDKAEIIDNALVSAAGKPKERAVDILHADLGDSGNPAPTLTFRYALAVRVRADLRGVRLGAEVTVVLTRKGGDYHALLLFNVQNLEGQKVQHVARFAGLKAHGEKITESGLLDCLRSVAGSTLAGALVEHVQREFAHQRTLDAENGGGATSVTLFNYNGTHASWVETDADLVLANRKADSIASFREFLAALYPTIDSEDKEGHCFVSINGVPIKSCLLYGAVLDDGQCVRDKDVIIYRGRPDPNGPFPVDATRVDLGENNGRST
eukprot:tig00000042_g15657.t1